MDYSEQEIRQAVREIIKANSIVRNPIDGRIVGVINDTEKIADKSADQLIGVMRKARVTSTYFKNDAV
jgi:hypothetical protein